MSIKRPAVLAFTFLFLFVFVMSDMTEVRAAEEKNGNNVKIASDIKGHWAGTALADFNQKGYLKGDENGNLNPDKTMSRAEYAAVINRVMQFSQESGDISKFTDVKPDDWYRADLAKALKAGYMKGTGESTMSPKATITREQAFVMLYRLTYPKGADMKNAADLKKFNDGAQVSEYAREAISVLAAKGVITGEYGNLNPKKDISRAQAVLVLSKSEKQLTIALNAMNEQEFVGSGAGYGGTLKVKVLFNKGKIVDIKIISSSETGSYLARAEKIIAQIIEKQSVDGIDNVSGATLSCNAIKDAVRDCISQQKGKGSIGTFGIKGKNRGEGAADPKKELRFEKLLEGKYIGVASGHYTDSMKAEVTVNSDGNITDISYTSGDDKVGYMTDEWAQETIKKIKKTKSTLDIDTISGATNSCNGLINAIVNALEQAVPEKIISESCDLDGAKYNLAKIIAAGVTVANLDAKKLEIGEDVKDGEVTLENSVIRGDLIVKGGGSNSIHLSDVKIEGNTIIEKPAGERVRLVVENGTQIGNKLQVKTPAIIETDKISEIDKVELPRSFESSKETTINANIKKLNIRTQTANIKVKNGSTVGDIGLPEVVEEYSPQKKHYQGNGGKFNLNIEGGTTVASGSNKNSVTSDFNDGTYYGESYGFSTSERQNKNGERKGFTFPKKNLVKVKIENGKVTQAEIELFADDDDDGANYSKGAKNVIEYLKKTNLEEAYEKIHKTKHAGEIAAVSGATRSANGVLRALDKALSDAKEGETQVYKAMWLANEPSRVVEHIWTEKEKEKYDQLTGEEKEKYKKEIEKVTTKQYFGEQLRLTPSSVRLIKTTVPIPEVTKENKEKILNLGEEIAHTDFASNGIEAFVTDKRGNRIDENKVINRKDGDENTADFKLHWLHKSSGLEIIKEVQLQRKSVYIPLSRMQLEFTDGSFEYVYIKTGNESMQGDNVYEHTMDLRGKELKDIKLFKKDSTEVKLQSFGS
ncbi:MAG: FMN-binding protein, partial [Eubacteriales bacterium]